MPERTLKNAAREQDPVMFVQRQDSNVHWQYGDDMLEEADLEFNKFLSDIHRNMFKTLEENEILQEEVIALRKENKVLRNLLVESKAVLEKKRDLEERMDALEARINENEAKQAKWAQANVNWAESLTKVTIAKNKKN